MEKCIVFKARRKDNGEWVQGAYFCMHHTDGRTHEHHFIIPDGTPLHLGQVLDKIQVEIDPDTLGVFTKASDTGLEEMLMVERKKVQCLYASTQKIVDPTSKSYIEGKLSAYRELFGDKCLPYQKEWKDTGSGAMSTTPPAFKLDVKSDTPNTPDSGELKTEVAENEAKFKVGDKVIIGEVANQSIRGKIGVVERLPTDKYPLYSIRLESGLYTDLTENYLTPYTEEKEPIEDKESGKEDGFPTKELNLSELLKDLPRGESLFSISQGMVKFISGQSTCKGYPIQIYCDDSNEVFLRTADGKVQKEGLVDLYPSEGLLRKYPFNPEGAWSEWASERKPKRWRAEPGSTYWRINIIGDANIANEYDTDADNGCRNFGNYFRTEEEAQRAAEAVRETLTKFHEQNKKQNGEKKI